MYDRGMALAPGAEEERDLTWLDMRVWIVAGRIMLLSSLRQEQSCTTQAPHCDVSQPT